MILSWVAQQENLVSQIRCAVTDMAEGHLEQYQTVVDVKKHRL